MELPDSAWTELSMDFCGPYPNRQYIMVAMYEYSRYPVTILSLLSNVA
jgi:hypothetical protein